MRFATGKTSPAPAGFAPTAEDLPSYVLVSARAKTYHGSVISTEAVKRAGHHRVGRTATGDISQVAMQKSGFAERQLWCAVVERALQDAIGPTAINARNELRRPERQDALEWFMENGRDYQMACDAAGIDAEYLRHHVLTLARRKSEAP